MHPAAACVFARSHDAEVASCRAGAIEAQTVPHGRSDRFEGAVFAAMGERGQPSRSNTMK
jgi:hypothetical protein